MSRENLFLRYASPSERRMISREDLGFYSNIVVGSIYDFDEGSANDIDLQGLQTFVGPLRHCIAQFPYLKIVTRDASTEKPFFERATSLNIQQHLSVVVDGGPTPTAGNSGDGDGDDDDDHRRMEKLLESLVDKPNSIASTPPWRVVVRPITPARCFVAFAFSHIIGDGPAALAFHRAFLDGLRQQQKTGLLHVNPPLAMPVSEFTLPDPFDVPGRLPISWSFLLGPLLAVLLPKFVAGWLGLQANAAKVNEGTWTGSDVFFEPGAQRSRVKMFAINEAAVSNALKASRDHGTKLTGTVHQLVVRALRKHVTDDKAITNFVSQTAISMRSSIGVPGEEWGNYASGCYGTHPANVGKNDEATNERLPDQMWENASSLSKAIAERAVQLQDQPLGLLRYAPSIRKWILGKVGGRRDCSYEVSNLTSFDGGSGHANTNVKHKEEKNEEGAGVGEEETTSCRLTNYRNKSSICSCRITKMVFAQPGGVVSAPLAFNLVSVRGGPLVGTITWGQGALGVPIESEDALVEGIRQSFVDDFAAIDSS
ncbi:alcohol acetyltransferase [Apiospora saccharicola]